MKTVLELLNPRDRRGFYVVPHILLLAFIAFIVLLAITLATIHYNASYFHHRYAHFGIKIGSVETRKEPIPLLPHALFPATGTINLTLYPSVGEQDGQGSCAAWAVAWYLSFLWRESHPHNPGLRFSPRWLYDHYSTTYMGGKDGGSWPDQLVEPIASIGVPRFRAYPSPPYQMDSSYPQSAIDNANKFKFSVEVQTLSDAMGGGEGAIDAIKAAIAQGKPVFVAFPVWNEYENATSTNGNVGLPTKAELAQFPDGLGGHGNVVIGWDDTRPMPDGTTGALEVQNQWSKHWGLAGRGWISYAFAARYFFGVKVFSIGPATQAVGLARVPAGGIYGLHNPSPAWIISSAFWWEAGLLHARPSGDYDYGAGYGVTWPVHLPGTHKNTYILIDRRKIEGSGWYETFRPLHHPNSYFAYLHLQKTLKGRIGTHHHGGDWAGHSGWPTSPIYGNGLAGPANAHLCTVVTWQALRFLNGIADHHRYVALKPHILPIPTVRRGITIYGNQTFPAPAITRSVAAHRGHGGWWAHNIITKDTHVRLDRLINDAGKRYHLWPLGIAALIGTESDVHQYANRYGSGNDVSFGLTQVTVGLAHQYGVGDGSLSSANEAYVRSWESKPNNAIRLSARVLRDYKRVCGWPFSPLYVCYNAGPYLGYRASFYRSPTGVAGSNYVNYRSWVNYAWATWR